MQPHATRATPSFIANICVIHDGTLSQIPEHYPRGLYGYAKIFAIKHAPADEVLWLDCDVYPVRPLEPLFVDKEFRRTGAMYVDEHASRTFLPRAAKWILCATTLTQFLLIGSGPTHETSLTRSE